MAESRRRSRRKEPPVSQPELTATHAQNAGEAGTVGPQFPAGSPSLGGLRPGTEFGRYRIERLLGRGAMGAVYLAQDSALGRPVALKVPTVDDSDGEARARFQREARSAAVLQHPGICPIHDVGEINGTLYLTMAFIDGRPLSDVTDAKEPVSPRQAAKLIRRLALALAEAHDAGVIHRDLKPANIMLNRRNEPVVMDFGLARWYDGEDRSRLTESGALVGSPAYMSPEQVRGEVTQLGPPADIYSLGAVFYELLTGRTPFEGTLLAVLAAILTDTPPTPRELQPEIDPALEAVCLRMLEKQAEDRFSSMEEVAEALARCLSGAAAACSMSGVKLSAADSAYAADAGNGDDQSSSHSVPARRRLQRLLARGAALGRLPVTWLQAGFRHVRRGFAAGQAGISRAGTAIRSAARSRWQWCYRTVFGEDPWFAGVSLGSGVLIAAIALGLVIRSRPSDRDEQAVMTATGLSSAAQSAVEVAHSEPAVPPVAAPSNTSTPPSQTAATGSSPADDSTSAAATPEPRATDGEPPDPESAAPEQAAEPEEPAEQMDPARRAQFLAERREYARVLGEARRELDAENREEALALLESCDPAHRGWEHTYLHLLASREGQTIDTGPLRGIAFSPDGQRIAGVSHPENGKRSIKIWDVSSGRVIRKLDESDNVFGSNVAWSPDGGRIACGNLVWDAETGRKAFDLPRLYTALQRDSSRQVRSIQEGHNPQFSPDGTRILMSGGWQDADGNWHGVLGAAGGNRQIFLLHPPHRGTVTYFDFSPDGRRIVSSSNSKDAIGRNYAEIIVWNTASGEVQFTLKEQGISVSGASYSPDGSRIAFAIAEGGSSKCVVCDAETGETQQEVHTSILYSLTFSPDSEHLTGMMQSSRRTAKGGELNSG